MADPFRSWRLSVAATPFDELLASVPFDEVTRGRRGAVLVKLDDTGAVPLVRTTTASPHPARPFRDLHDRIAAEVRQSGGIPCGFNNALVEHYTRAYATMKRHSDLALDLAEESWIAVYSCYRDPQRPSRRLVVTPKPPDGPDLELVLPHHGVVAFALDTNRRFTHRIALVANAPDNDWLGITFRTSKTLVRFVDGQPQLPDGSRLTLATEAERRTFFQLRRRENEEPDFAYPPIPYTISEGDLLAPAG